MVDLSTRFGLVTHPGRVRGVLERSVNAFALAFTGVFGAAAHAQTIPNAPSTTEHDPIGRLIALFSEPKAHALDGSTTKKLINLGNGYWQYGDHKIKEDLYRLIESVAKEHGFPNRVFLDIIARESSFNPRAKNESGACGLIQFMPATLYEMVYKYGGDLKGFEGKKLNERIEKKKVMRADGKSHTVAYNARTVEDEKYLQELCFNPTFNLRLGIRYKLSVAATLQQYLDGIKPLGQDYYPLKPHELYLGFFAGPTAAEKIIRDAHIGRDIPITYYFSPTALANEANKKVIYEQDGKTALSGRKLLGNIARSMGYDPGLNGADMLPLPDIRRLVFKEAPKARQIEDLLRTP